LKQALFGKFRPIPAGFQKQKISGKCGKSGKSGSFAEYPPELKRKDRQDRKGGHEVQRDPKFQIPIDRGSHCSCVLKSE
jgi:hypothetical protein